MEIDKRLSALEYGKLSEAAVANYLERELGWRLLAKNYRVRGGEIDIVALDPAGPSLVFVEIKARTNTWISGLTPAMSVHKRKRHRLHRAASQYLSEATQKAPPSPWQEIRLDVVLLCGQEIVEHLQGESFF